jgi:protein TonB
MFEQSILESRQKRTRWTTSLAVLIELSIVGVMILIPLIYAQVLPMAAVTSLLTLPPPPMAPPPPPPPAAAHVAKVVPRQFKLNVLTAPIVVPKEPVIASAVADSPDLSTSMAGVPGGVPGGVPNGMVSGIVGSVGVAAPPPPPAPAPVAPPTRIQVGGQVQAAKLIHQVVPEYPQLAHAARVAGVVRLKAIIAKDGTIKDLSVISGHPLLIPAAVNAVKQWIYRPTILNGQPIEVDTEVDVTFAQTAT